MDRIVLDFDGVLHDYSMGWNEGKIEGEPIEGSVEAFFELMKTYEVVVCTARTNLDDVANWMMKHFKFTERLGYEYVPIITNIKYPAHFYIDDRGIRFGDWDYTLKLIKSLEDK